MGKPGLIFQTPRLKLGKCNLFRSASDLYSDMKYNKMSQPRAVEEGKSPEEVESRVRHAMAISQLQHLRDQPVNWDSIDRPGKTDLVAAIHNVFNNFIRPDLFVRIGVNQYSCHLMVLNSYSKYFHNCRPGQIVYLPENEVLPDAFCNVYMWMLGSKCNIEQLLTRKNILDVLMVTLYLHVPELEEQCWAFIDSPRTFVEETALLLYLDALSRGIESVMELMRPRVVKCFLSLVGSDVFDELPLEVVCKLLSSSAVEVNCEMQIFMAGIKWLIHDWDKRKHDAVDVMKCVRFGLMAPWQLVDIRRNPLNPYFIRVTEIPEVKLMVAQAAEYSVYRTHYTNLPIELRQSLDVIGFNGPEKRNWIGEERTYLTLEDFLDDIRQHDDHRSEQTLTVCCECEEGEHHEEGAITPEGSATCMHEENKAAERVPPSCSCQPQRSVRPPDLQKDLPSIQLRIQALSSNIEGPRDVNERRMAKQPAISSEEPYRPPAVHVVHPSKEAPRLPSLSVSTETCRFQQHVSVLRRVALSSAEDEHVAQRPYIVNTAEQDIPRSSDSPSFHSSKLCISPKSSDRLVAPCQCHLHDVGDVAQQEDAQSLRSTTPCKMAAAGSFSAPDISTRSDRQADRYRKKAVSQNHQQHNDTHLPDCDRNSSLKPPPRENIQSVTNFLQRFKSPLQPVKLSRNMSAHHVRQETQAQQQPYLHGTMYHDEAPTLTVPKLARQLEEGCDVRIHQDSVLPADNGGIPSMQNMYQSQNSSTIERLQLNPCPYNMICEGIPPRTMCQPKYNTVGDQVQAAGHYPIPRLSRNASFYTNHSLMEHRRIMIQHCQEYSSGDLQVANNVVHNEMEKDISQNKKRPSSGTLQHSINPGLQIKRSYSFAPAAYKSF